jgi:hypothetical protein
MSRSVKPVCFFTDQQTLPFTVPSHHTGREQKRSPIEWGETLGVLSPFASHLLLPVGARGSKLIQ